MTARDSLSRLGFKYCHALFAERVGGLTSRCAPPSLARTDDTRLPLVRCSVLVKADVEQVARRECEHIVKVKPKFSLRPTSIRFD